MAKYQSGRGYGGGQGQRGPRLDENATLGDIINRNRSGYRTQSLWQGRSSFLQTAGNEDRSIMPSTVVPRGTAQGGALAQAAWKVGKDKAKMRFNVPDIALKDWGGEGPKGYKIRDVIAAAKGQGRSFDYSNVVSNVWQAPRGLGYSKPTPLVGSPSTPVAAASPAPFGSPSGPAIPGGPTIGPAKPVSQPIMMGNLSFNPAAVVGAAQTAAANPAVRGAVAGAATGAAKGAKFGVGGALVGAGLGAAKGARTPKPTKGSAFPGPPI